MLHLLLPERCVACGSAGTQVCPHCLGRAPRLRPPLCDRCGAATAWPVSRCRECAGRRLAFARARAAVAYDDAVRRIVVAWKERGLRRLAAPLALVVAEVVPCPAADALCALPPDPERKLKRGHDPPAALTAELARHWNLPVEPLLARPRASPQQRGLPLRQRRRNVAQAFVARGRSPARLVLVDDVYTTGSTVDAAARELRRAGARRVEVVTLARAVRRG